MTDGSTRVGPGLRRNTSGTSIENQMRPPAMRGMVTVREESFSREMEQSWVSGCKMVAGEVGW